MTFEQIFVIRDEILRVIDSRDLKGDRIREIARITAPLDDGRTAASLRRERENRGFLSYFSEGTVRQ